MTEWSSTENWNLKDLTTTCSGGYQEKGKGIRGISATFTGFFDPTVGEIAEISSGNVLDMTVNLGNSASFVTGNFLVADWKITNNATEYVTIEVSIESTGAYTINEA